MEGRTPLVYATTAARAEAERFPIAGCLENAVQDEIRRGNVTASQTGGLVFDREKRWIAIVRRVPARTHPKRRAWLITRLKSY